MWGFQKKTTFIYLAFLYRLYKDVTDTVNKESGTVVKSRARS